MSSRTPIQVPTELRDELNEMSDRLRVKTQYEVIQKLLAYYHRSEKEKNDLKAYQEQHMVDLGKDSKIRFKEIQQELGLRTEGAVFEFLADCYQGSMQMPMLAFETYRKLKMEGK
ncbi:hypothetical protein [Paenibacillus lactis]|uniref:Ribbon-helix-helix protein CopG domain-containing protein n=1 Tax=Paenibacillus lactis TaxID=228574 RepID=A0ABS4FLB9_9BACL|nr:hypothetical protein [Paenibacillus lactis]MBP1897067.1 hypothetical protein [Paenibacillus lactis]HAS7789863.1 hypothetical protein [Vibrio cholerae]